jgi:hypothetical protein
MCADRVSANESIVVCGIIRPCIANAQANAVSEACELPCFL